MIEISWVRIAKTSAIALFAFSASLFSAPAASQEIQAMRDENSRFAPVQATSPAPPPPPAPAHAAPPVSASLLAARPFGSNLFTGSFLKAREDGLNPDYIVLPGDRVAVATWGAVELNEVFIVDSQGNIFLPQIGPVLLAGHRNADLSGIVKAAIQRVYTRYVNVYINLLNAGPVAVFVTGGVKQPGRYAGLPSDSPLFFIDQSGGIDPALGSFRKITVLRGAQVLAEIDLYDFILAGKLARVQLQDGDTILVGQRGPTVELMGDVAAPSLVELKSSPAKGKEALDVVPNVAKATEVTLAGTRSGKPFNSTMLLDEFRGAQIQDGDVVTLRAAGQADTIVVRVEGEQRGPSEFSVPRGARLLDVLRRIPIDKALADPLSVHIRRQSVAKAQKDAIEDSLFRLERATLLALSQSKGEAEIRVREAELVSKFAERARAIDPLGRVVTSQDGVQLNILLEDKDVIVVPRRTNVIRIGGEVMMNQAVVYSEDLRAKHYIRRAGGFTDRADRHKVILLHANAELEIGGTRTKVNPGDEILVPPAVDFKGLQISMDIMQVIYQVAMSAAVVLAL
ncbi:MAG: polysaccharide biosynthesis/export family protein [Myxococcota bacterium]|nr:polysaccharide biosynthesis/export family protein [Myxococcota bacterium]